MKKWDGKVTITLPATLELVGFIAIVAGIAIWSVAVAVVTGGVLAIGIAQVLHDRARKRGEG